MKEGLESLGVHVGRISPSDPEKVIGNHLGVICVEISNFAMPHRSLDFGAFVTRPRQSVLSRTD